MTGNLLYLLISILLGYLIGSIPSAYLFGKIFKGVDIRKEGSGNIGATNAFRVLGKPLGTLTLILDIAKGWGSVFLAIKCFEILVDWQLILVGLAAVLGHTFTLFLKFKGGKGVATTFGISLAYFPLPAICTMAIWLILFFTTQYASMASIISAVCFPILIYFLSHNMVYFTLGLILGIFIIIRHRGNIKRLFQGTENKVDLFSQKKD